MTVTTQNSPTIETKKQLTALPWLTGEVFVYLLIGLLAVGLRLYNLGAYPLTDAEASNALAALDIYNGAIPAAGSYSPLTATLTAVSFFLFGPTAWSARLAATILGAALVLLPYGLRRQVGTLGALASAGLLAVSASTLHWSRTLSGDIGAALGIMLLLVGGVKWLNEDKPQWLYGIASGLVLLLLSSPAGYTALATLLVMLLVVALTNRGAFATLQQKTSEAGEIVSWAGATIRWVAAWFMGLLVILATAFFLNLTGLAAISDLFTQWLGQFGLQPVAGAGYPAFFSLLFYEPLILVFGGVGVAVTLWNRYALDWLLAIWVVVIVVIDLLMGGRSGGQILLLVVPLAILAGRQFGLLWGQLHSRARLDSEGLYIAVGLMVAAFIYISLTSWSKCTSAQAGCDTAWVLPLAGALLIVGLTVVFWVWYRRGVALRGLGVLALVAAGALSLGASWRLNYNPLKDLPFQPMIRLSASSRLETMVAEIERISAAQVGDPREIDVAVVDLDTPMLRWQLRQFANARFEHDFTSAQNASIILARPAAGEPLSSYVGQEFALISHWNPNLVQGKDWLRWYLFRTLPNHTPGSDQVVMWAEVN